MKFKKFKFSFIFPVLSSVEEKDSKNVLCVVTFLDTILLVSDLTAEFRLGFKEAPRDLEIYCISSNSLYRASISHSVVTFPSKKPKRNNTSNTNEN